MIPILLTASVDTRGMKGAKFTAKEREKMYVDTLNYYIKLFGSEKYDTTLVFAENSGWSSGSIVNQLYKNDKVTVEYLSLALSDFVQEKGKSYNEMLLIDKAIEKSSSIKDNGCFFKVTGRFPIANLNVLVNEVYKIGGGVKFYCDCKDHNLYDWLHIPINGHAGECRYYAVSLDFYNVYFKDKYTLMGIDTGVCVEQYFLDVIRKTKHLPGVKCRFRTQAHITGTGGHSLGKGWAFFYSTDNDSTILKFKRGLRQLFRWVLPWWWC